MTVIVLAISLPELVEGSPAAIPLWRTVRLLPRRNDTSFCLCDIVPVWVGHALSPEENSLQFIELLPRSNVITLCHFRMPAKPHLFTITHLRVNRTAPEGEVHILGDMQVRQQRILCVKEMVEDHTEAVHR